MKYSTRTTHCGALRSANANTSTTLNGWIHRLRDHGGIYFIDLRDRYGITQIVINEHSPTQVQEAAKNLHHEYCVAISGTIQLRPSETINKDMPTGEIEVHVTELQVLSQSDTPPFMIEETKSEANEDLRLKYRYLDLRSGYMQSHIHLRHKVMQTARQYLNAQDFLEIETPTLIRSTPEGARDFLVPSRIKAGAFYALPQSPQLYKQILMMSGMDKYYQFARCYRDEDARGDRQPEHTQLDIEMSFITPQDIFTLIEGLLSTIFETCLQISLSTPFPRLCYQEAMDTYGSDKPDLRFELPLQDFSSTAPKLNFGVFTQALELFTENAPSQTGCVKLLRIPQGESISRKQIESLESTAKKYGAKGLSWAKYTHNNGFAGGISKFLSEHTQEIVSTYNIQDNDLLLFGADTWMTACTALGAVRLEVAKLLELFPNTNPPKQFSLVWITDFPLFDWVAEHQSWTPAHHMFTMPQAQYIEGMLTNPQAIAGQVKGELYDLVCNGVELASGSIRIHDMELQQKVFEIIGMEKEEAASRFGFLLEALRFGPPPHGGIAPGLDRLLMLMTGVASIREVIPFPKNTLASSPMDECPNTVSLNQLEELHLQIVHKNDETQKDN